MQLEQPEEPAPGPRSWLADVGVVHASNALIAFLFAASAPVAIVLGVGLKGGLSEAELSSWVFGGFALNGVLSIIVSIVYRQPLAFFWTISGSVLVGPALTHLSFQEVIGAFLATGILLLVLGLSGLVGKIMKLLPMPIIMGMVAGVFLEFGLDWVRALWDDPLLAGSMTAAFVLLSLNRRLAERFPPMIGVLIVGIVVILAQGSFNPEGGFGYQFVTPIVFRPEFSLPAMIELVIPLAITVLAAQNAQGIAILQTRDHKPPVNTITAACGFNSLIIGMFGSVSTCLTGPVNAILSSGGRKETHYIAAVIIGLFAILFGLHSPMFTKFLLASPPAFIATLAGLALLHILQSAFKVSFGGKFTLGALVSFLVTLTELTIFNIGAPFWGLVFGFAASWLLERDHFVK